MNDDTITLDRSVVQINKDISIDQQITPEVYIQSKYQEPLKSDDRSESEESGQMQMAADDNSDASSIIGAKVEVEGLKSQVQQ